ncbi:unnamed protein product [Lactuca saligna]|uniref:Uncharacterized protein n=1 Tax=Lactuca saligna TaxID=75948 RepID=A0AA35YCI1_LACSI|nr:unnamed protein product [Lactuca saligna]
MDLRVTMKPPCRVVGPYVDLLHEEKGWSNSNLRARLFLDISDARLWLKDLEDLVISLNYLALQDEDVVMLIQLVFMLKGLHGQDVKTGIPAAVYKLADFFKYIQRSRGFIRFDQGHKHAFRGGPSMDLRVTMKPPRRGGNFVISTHPFLEKQRLLLWSSLVPRLSSSLRIGVDRLLFPVTTSNPVKYALKRRPILAKSIDPYVDLLHDEKGWSNSNLRARLFPDISDARLWLKDLEDLVISLNYLALQDVDVVMLIQLVFMLKGFHGQDVKTGIPAAVYKLADFFKYIQRSRGFIRFDQGHKHAFRGGPSMDLRVTMKPPCRGGNFVISTHPFLEKRRLLLWLSLVPRLSSSLRIGVDRLLFPVTTSNPVKYALKRRPILAKSSIYDFKSGTDEGQIPQCFGRWIRFPDISDVRLRLKDLEDLVISLNYLALQDEDGVMLIQLVFMLKGLHGQDVKTGIPATVYKLADFFKYI